MGRAVRRSRASVAMVAALTVLSGLLVVVTSSAADATPKPKPVGVTTAAEVIAAAQKKDQLAAVVGRLNAQVAQAQIAASQAQGRFQLSEQRVARALANEAAAKTAATAAQQTLRAATGKALAAHDAYVDYIQAAYYGESIDGTAGSLLTADDPDDVLERSTLQSYQADNKIDAIARFQTAQVAKSNADARAKAAADKARRLTATAKAAVVTARADYLAAQSTESDLATQKANQSALLGLARNTLAAKQSARANYLTYLQNLADYNAEQKRIREARARAVALAKARAAAAAAAAEAARKAREHSGSSNGGSSNGGGGGSSSGGGGGSSNAPGPSAPGGGSWTAAKGRKAANRALSLLGDLYIFAGGNKYGPTAGGCTDPIAPCGTLGYDCSGLVLYAWYSNWNHFAATQYSQAGSYHPSSSNFKPGDLLFWSENGTQGGIGHVAVYIGNDNVVQAPQSGDVVKITKWYAVESGYYGATRPLT